MKISHYNVDHGKYRNIKYATVFLLLTISVVASGTPGYVTSPFQSISVEATLTPNSQNATIGLSGNVSELSVESPVEGTSNDTNTNITAMGQPPSVAEETQLNASEVISDVFANRSKEVSVIEEFLESGNLEPPPSLPKVLLGPILALASLSCSSMANPCVGTAHSDEMTGDNGYNEMYGMEGQDWMYGRAGDDYMEGNADLDRMYGEDGNDFIIGGPEGFDYDFMNGGNGNDWIFGVFGDDHVIGELGDDVLTGGSNRDGVWGGFGNDVLGGGDGDDGAGQDSIGGIYGGEGNDYIAGEFGADRIFGNEGNDIIFHGQSESTFNSSPDGSKDIISCGPGIRDRVWASTSSDGDTVAADCEIVHFDVALPDDDETPNKDDNCPNINNPDQLDSDDDGMGNKCDADDDNDGKVDVVDNCGYRRGSPLEYNPDQRDMDSDGIGDPCDFSP